MYNVNVRSESFVEVEEKEDKFILKLRCNDVVREVILFKTMKTKSLIDIIARQIVEFGHSSHEAGVKGTQHAFRVLLDIPPNDEIINHENKDNF